MQTDNKKTIGIVGGMGPAAGVHLQQLIINATDAENDQQHIPVICYTNPSIPDRTISLSKDNGVVFAVSVIETCRVLQSAGADMIIIPCNTAHSRLDIIEAHITTPVLDMPLLTMKSVKNLGIKSIGLLATNGARDYQVFESRDDSTHWVYPNEAQQAQVMQIIYDTKKRPSVDSLNLLKHLIADLRSRGAEAVILGCTELSLYFDDLQTQPVIDPLRIVSEYAVQKVVEASQVRMRSQ